MRQLFKYSAVLLIVLLWLQFVKSQPIIANHFCIDVTKIPITMD